MSFEESLGKLVEESVAKAIDYDRIAERVADLLETKFAGCIRPEVAAGLKRRITITELSKMIGRTRGWINMRRQRGEIPEPTEAPGYPLSWPEDVILAALNRLSEGRAG